MGVSINAGATAPITCARSTETSRAMRENRARGPARAEPGVTVHRGTAEDRLHVVERRRNSLTRRFVA